MRKRCLPWLLCLLAPVAVSAVPPPVTRLDTALGTLPLPGEARVESHQWMLTRTGGLRANEEFVLVPLSGPRAGQSLDLRVAFVTPDGMDAGRLEQLTQRVKELAAAKPGTREMRPLRLAGYDFALVDTTGPYKDGSERRMAQLLGTVGPTMVTASVFDPDNADAAPDLLDLLAAVELDFQRILGARQRLDEQSTAVLGDARLDTLVGELPLPRGAEAVLVDVTQVMGPAGEVVAGTQTLAVYKTGAFSERRLGLKLTCDRHIGRSDSRLALMRDPFTARQGLQFQAREAPARLGGVEALRTDATQASADGTETSISHWFAREGDTAYAIRIEHVRGEKLQRELEQGLEQIALSCRAGQGGEGG